VGKENNAKPAHGIPVKRPEALPVCVSGQEPDQSEGDDHQRLARSSRTQGLRLPALKSATPDSAKNAIARTTRAGWEKKGGKSQAKDGEAEISEGPRHGDECHGLRLRC